MDARSTAWQDLQRDLAGSFSVRVAGVVRPQLVLANRDGEEFGRLTVHGLEGASLEAGGLEAGIQRSGKTRYRMLSDGEEILSAETDPAENPSVTCKGESYEIRMRLLRPFAEASSPRGGTARVEGRLLRRGYEVTLDAGDGCALPVALFLVYYLFVVRSRAYTAKK